jgi:microcystin degradation protein MlrC
VQPSSIIVPCKKFPRPDVIERAQDLFTLIPLANRDETRRVTALYGCRQPTEIPLCSPDARLRGTGSRRKEGRHAVDLDQSLLPRADVAPLPGLILVGTDGDMAQAERLATKTDGTRLHARGGDCCDRYVMQR